VKASRHPANSSIGRPVGRWKGFGHDFSQTRVHAGAKTSASADALDASAYTFGHDIVWGDGPSLVPTGGGLHLLAHELAHVVQQTRLVRRRR
jgi:hypothetical protein